MNKALTKTVVAKFKLRELTRTKGADDAEEIRAYEKCRFVREGSEREAAFVDGTWHDDVMMGILDREYAERRKEA